MAMRIALAQLAPRLGEVDANLELAASWTRRAAADGADLVVFPEMALTGYVLRDLVPEVAMRTDDPRLTELAFYSLGLALPFIAAAAALPRLEPVMGALRRWHRPIEVIAGIFIMLMGLLIYLNAFARMASLFTWFL